mmetsp:Transcript_28172/g.68521  ORF Transcript_28172/g.68521 Transcript_28172/m.68521 type:complete len:341 (+) Transcript_28172:51-1073(+)
MAVGFSTAVGALVTAVAVIYAGLHKIEEGHVGVYWFGGALLSSTTDPGYHVKSPFTTSRQVFVKMQTDKVTNIPCGTSGGVMLYFAKIEVVNRLRREFVYQTIKNYTINYDKTLIYDKIHHEINQFCSTHTLQEVYIDKFDQLDEALVNSLQKGCDASAPGIEIIAVRVTKPQIPASIQSNYEQMEREKTKLLISQQRQLVTLKEAETAAKKEVIEAEKNKRVAEINAQKHLSEKESEAKMAAIEDQVYIDTQKALADAEFYAAEKEAESNRVLFSPEYLENEHVLALDNSQFILGERIPSTLVLGDKTFLPHTSGVATQYADDYSERQKYKSKESSKSP